MEGLDNSTERSGSGVGQRAGLGLGIGHLLDCIRSAERLLGKSFDIGLVLNRAIDDVLRS